MKKIIILTSTELRHKYFRVFLSQQNGIRVLKTFSEDGWTLKKQLIDAKSNLKEEHLNLRNKSEISLLKNIAMKQKIIQIILHVRKIICPLKTVLRK